MNTKKHPQNDKLQKSSKLFLQLGLVLALLISYATLEFSQVKKSLTDITKENTDTNDVFVFPEAPERYIIERKVKPKQQIEKKVQTPQQLDNFELTETIEPIEDIIFTPELDDTDIDAAIEKLPNNTKEEDIEVEYFKVEIKPTFKECADLYEAAQNECFQKQIQKYINKNLEYPEDAVDAGKQGRSLIEFLINENGEIKNVQIYKGRALYKSLDQAAIKAVSKLPKMIPGKQGNKNVKVKYVVPVKFKLH